VTIVPGLGAWRRLPRAFRLPATLRQSDTRAARGERVLLDHALRRFRSAGTRAGALRVPQVVHVYSSYGEARPYRKHSLGQARHVIATVS
jgi:hypothetical protein